MAESHKFGEPAGDSTVYSGHGEETYTMQQYADKCKELDKKWRAYQLSQGVIPKEDKSK